VTDKDPSTSPLRDLAGMMSLDEYLGTVLDIYFED